MKSWPIWLHAVVFLPAGAVIWWAGTRLERDADEIARRTGLGRAFTGMLLLAAATSLPELATTATAVLLLGDPTLAVHNLLGGVAMQTLLLVGADWAKPARGALTFFSPRFSLLVQGVGLVLLLQIAVAGISTRGSPAVFSVSLWLVFLAAGYLAVLFLVYRSRGMPRWTPSRRDDSPAEVEESAAVEAEAESSLSPRRVWLRFAGASALVLVAGWLATTTAEALAVQTGLGSAFVGATLLALATSLPELSTTFAAARRQRYTLAISNVFGSNAFDVVLLFLADLLYRRDTVLAHVEGPVVFVAALGGIMTCFYVWGLLEHENRSVLGIGWDSALALATYLGGMAALYFLA